MKRTILCYSFFLLMLTSLAYAQNECTLQVDTVYRTTDGVFYLDGTWHRNDESLNKFSTAIGVFGKKDNGVPYFRCVHPQEGMYQLWEGLTKWDGDIPYPAVFYVYNYGTKPVEMYSGKWCCKNAICNPTVIQPGKSAIISVKDIDENHAIINYGLKVLHFSTNMGPFNIHTTSSCMLQRYETHPDNLQFSAQGGEFIIHVKTYSLLSQPTVYWLNAFSVLATRDGVKSQNEIRISCKENTSSIPRETRLLFNTPSGKISIPIVQEGTGR